MTLEELVRHLEDDHGFENYPIDRAEACHQRLHRGEIIQGFNYHAHDRAGTTVLSHGEEV